MNFYIKNRTLIIFFNLIVFWHCNVFSQHIIPKFKYEIDKLKFNDDKIAFSAVLHDGKVIFISPGIEKGEENRDENIKNINNFDYFYVDRDSVDYNVTPKLFERGVNTRQNEGPLVFYDDGTKVIFTKNEEKYTRKNKKRISRVGIFFANVSSTGDWTKIEPFKYNTIDYSIGHPAIHPNGKFLVFMSKNPSGKGKSDLYLSKNLNGKGWTTPVQLVNLNTSNHEAFPIFSPLGNLFFSSTRPRGVGGMDLYISHTSTTEDEIVFKPPKRLPLGINSVGDDLSICWETSKSAFLVSNKGNANLNDDIYLLGVDIPYVIERLSPIKDYIVEVFDENENLIQESNLVNIDDFKFSNDAGQFVVITRGLDGGKEMKIKLSEKGEHIDRLIKRYKDENEVVAVVPSEEVSPIPNAPIVKPDIPVVMPEVPVVTLEVPVVKPDVPVVKPDVPIVKPDVPIVKPDVPIVKPDAPIVKPDAPIVKPDAPIVKPDVPIVKPDVPIVKPDAPIVKPDVPVVEPKVAVVPSILKKPVTMPVKLKAGEMNVALSPRRGYVRGRGGKKVILPSLFSKQDVVKGKFGLGIPVAHSKLIESISKTPASKKIFIKMPDGYYYEAGIKSLKDVDVLPMYNEDNSSLIGYVINTEGVYFDFAKSTLRPSQVSYVKHIATVLKNNPEMSAKVRVKTDSRGSSQYNDILAKKRAERIEKLIQLVDVNLKNRLTVIPQGERNLLNECGNNVNCSEEKHVRNRVGSFTIIK